MNTASIKVQITLDGKALVIYDFVVNDNDTLSIPIDLFLNKNHESNEDPVVLTLKQYNSILTRLNQLEEAVKTKVY